MVAVLHTWGQNLHHHPHVHCVVPGGGPSPDGTRWVACRPGFFLPVRVLSRLYRRLFLEALQAAFEAGRLNFFHELAGLAEPTTFAGRIAQMRKIDWVVYAKPPFGGPDQVLAYLGRYTHRVAIANSRLVEIENGKVAFRWKDYRHHDKAKLMTLAGFLASGHRAAKIALCRRLLDAPAPPPTPLAADYRERCLQLTGHAIDVCPCCGGPMVTCGLIPPRRAPPPWTDTS
jgi:hypothetical protein